MCLAKGITRASEVVDHKIPHQGRYDPLMWDRNNLQALCKRCHDSDKQALDNLERRPWWERRRLGYAKDIGADGWPIDPNHPANTGKIP